MAGGSARKCWRVQGTSELVMFHGHHDHEFISHSHEVMTAILVTSGAVNVEVDGTHHRVGAGQLVLIGAHQVHSARPIDRTGWSMRSLHIPEAVVSGRDRTGGSVRFARPVGLVPDRAAALFLDLHRNSEKLPHQKSRHVELFQCFVDWLLENADSFEPASQRHGPVDGRLERAKHILATELFENRTLDSVADEVGLSIYSLIRHFKETYGFSPHAWRVQARANEAAKMIRGNEPLADIAGYCGFADQSHLNRVFKRVYGVTPGQYSLMH
jgi:AraC-like DNA-binding protein